MINVLKSLFETKPPKSCLVLGSGPGGLMAARRLREADIDVTIIDEAPQAGGLLHTVEFEGGIFDAGIQFITAESWQLRQRLQPLIETGTLAEWSRTFMGSDGVRANDRYPRLRCPGGMANLAAALAEGLDVRCGIPLTSASWRGNRWEVRAESDEEFVADALIITLPVPRGLAIIEAGNWEMGSDTGERLRRISFAPCLALLAVLEGPSGVPAPGGVFLSDPLLWIADNRRKGVSPGAWAVTIQAAPDFSREHWSSPDDVIAREMIGAAQAWLGSHVRASHVVRWEHCHARHRDQALFVEPIGDPPLLFAGAGFGTLGFEGAALSGLAAADHIATPRLNPIVSLLTP